MRDQGFRDFFLSSMRSISARDAELTNSETDLKPNSECISMNRLMFRYSSSGIFTSLYDLATDITYRAKIKRKFDIYGETFIKNLCFRHVWRNMVIL